MKITTQSILNEIYLSQPITRKRLCELTGFSLSRINAIVSKLIDHHVICEYVSQDGNPGRPAVLLSINPEQGRVVGLDIGGTNSRAVLCDLNGNILESILEPTETSPNRDYIVSGVHQLVEKICRQGGTRSTSLAGIGVGVSAIVDSRIGRVLAWPSVPDWSDVWTGLDLSKELHRLFRIEIIAVDDVARAMGLAAHRFGSAKNYKNFLYVLLGSGIGSSIFFDGHCYTGGSGITSELGHITVEEEGPWCICGNRGCLEVMASTSSVLRRVEERLKSSQVLSALREPFDMHELTLSTLIQAARDSDKLAFQILDETGAYIGRVVAIAINLLTPESVVLGGPLTRDGGITFDAIQRQVRLHSVPYISKKTQIILDDRGEFVGAQGSALMALDKLFSSSKLILRVFDLSWELEYQEI